MSSSRVLAPAVLLLAVLLPGCSSDPLGPHRGELEKNQEKWRAQGIASYTYDYRLNCFCGGPGIQPVRIEVREGEVVEVTLQETGEPVDPSTVDDFPTVEDLFGMIRNALEREPFRAEAAYDPLLGYPRDVFIDFEEWVADEEFGFVASDLQEP